MSAATMMNPGQQLPHRKPVPARTSYSNLQQPHPAAQYGLGPQPGTVPRTMTSSTSPQPGNPMYSAPPPQQQAQYARDSRRTLSNATTSTTSTNPGLQRAPTTSSQPRRSTSSRSTTSASPTSYVALMRKQKATVWCDRAQVEHPDILAKRRAIKMQAARDVAGGSQRYSSGSTQAPASVGIRSKIRHHGAPKANTYTGQGNMAGTGVPMRLSATEVDENDSDEEADSKYVQKYHSRNGSRGSSMGSNRQPTNSFLSSTSKEYSNGSTPQSGHSPGESPDSADPTPVPNDYKQGGGEYFTGDDADYAEERFGRVGGLPIRTREEHEKKNSEELRRRGSVDDRTMTMGGGRLFVANPDLSD